MVDKGGKLWPLFISDIIILLFTGMTLRPMWFVERVFIPIEEQYKYVSDEDADSDGEEWTLGPNTKKKKRNNESIAVSTGE